ncbi:MAG TPA: ABC transporter ATP-binding protein [Tepidisphaeraceae bacterium]|nr:ABC transporter ATP-binding protein [Tepidisphaeraceae bacterium]
MTLATASPTAAKSSTAKQSLLRTQNLHKLLGSGDAINHILKGIDLEIHREEYVSIVGTSGSGKSTLLYLLGGLDRPSKVDEDSHPFSPPSKVFIDGEDTAQLNDTELARFRNEKVGFVFQFHYLLKEFSAQENVALPMFKLGRLGKSAALDRAAILLKQLGLGEKLKRKANRLSGGEQQRVAIARALGNEPAVVLADEPTGNLDRANSEKVAEIFQMIADAGQTIVMVTHDQSFAARGRRMISMDDGMIVSDQTRAT